MKHIKKKEGASCILACFFAQFLACKFEEKIGKVFLFERVLATSDPHRLLNFLHNALKLPEWSEVFPR